MIRILLTIFFVVISCLSFGISTNNVPNKNFEVVKSTKVDTNTNKVTKKGKATWYGGSFHGKKTANGEIYNMHEMTCAVRNREIPFNTRIEVTCVHTGKKVIVRVNDRMAKNAARNIDLSTKAFKKIAPLDKGVLTIKYRFLAD